MLSIATLAALAMTAALTAGCGADKKDDDDDRGAPARQGDDDGTSDTKRAQKRHSENHGGNHGKNDGQVGLLFGGTDTFSGKDDCRVLVTLVGKEDDETAKSRRFIVEMFGKTSDGHSMRPVQGQFFRHSYDPLQNKETFVAAGDLSKGSVPNAIAGLNFKKGVEQTDDMTTDMNKYLQLLDQKKLKEVMRLDLREKYTPEQIVEGFERLIDEGDSVDASNTFNPIAIATVLSVHHGHRHSKSCNDMKLLEIKKEDLDDLDHGDSRSQSVRNKGRD